MLFLWFSFIFNTLEMHTVETNYSSVLNKGLIHVPPSPELGTSDRL